MKLVNPEIWDNEKLNFPPKIFMTLFKTFLFNLLNTTVVVI